MVGGWRLFTAAFSRLAAGRGLLPFGQRQRASRLVRAWLPCAGHERRCSRYTGPELRVCKLVRTAETHPLHRIRSSRTLLSSPESCPSLFLAYGRALFVVLRTRPQLRGRSNNVQVVDIKSSLNPPTAIYSGTRHLDCGWGTQGVRPIAAAQSEHGTRDHPEACVAGSAQRASWSTLDGQQCRGKGELAG